MYRSALPISRPIVIALVLLVVLGAGGALVWRAVVGPPVMVRAGNGPHVCVMCVETALPNSFVLQADRVSRSYRVRRDTALLVRFEGGSVVVDGTPLSAGCHVVPVAEDARIDFEGARGVLVRWPASDADCDDPTGTTRAPRLHLEVVGDDGLEPPTYRVSHRASFVLYGVSLCARPVRCS